MSSSSDGQGVEVDKLFRRYAESSLSTSPLDAKQMPRLCELGKAYLQQKARELVANYHYGSGRPRAPGRPGLDMSIVMFYSYSCVYDYLFMCIYIYIYTHIYEYVYTYTYIYTYVCRVMNVFIYMCMYIYIYIYIYVYMYIYVYIVMFSSQLYGGRAGYAADRRLAAAGCR